MAKKEKDFNIKDYVQSQAKIVPTIEYKEAVWLKMPECVQESICMPGFPFGHMSMLYGLSDSGKTGILLNAVKMAQQQGFLAVLIITENKLNKERLKKSGIDIDNLVIVEDLKCLENVSPRCSGSITISRWCTLMHRKNSSANWPASRTPRPSARSLAASSSRSSIARRTRSRAPNSSPRAPSIPT